MGQYPSQLSKDEANRVQVLFTSSIPPTGGPQRERKRASDSRKLRILHP